MKTKHFLCFALASLFLIILGIESSYSQTSTNYGWTPEAKISYVLWSNEGLADLYGGTTLFGAAIGKKISEDFKVNLFGDFGSETAEGLSMNYSQLGAMIEYCWYVFNDLSRPNLYGGIGAKGVFLKFSDSEYSESGNSIGFAFALGIEIPLGQKSLLDLGWDTTISSMRLDEENVQVGGQIFYAGVIFNLK